MQLKKNAVGIWIPTAFFVDTSTERLKVQLLLAGDPKTRKS
ncbi:hypothetical protein [Chamaesiphon polymorphus]|nr:hypothetical protein [Chamaesiphon polymorphus]